MKTTIFWIGSTWFVLGFLIDSIETMNNRTDQTCGRNEKKDWVCQGTSTSGCVYRSVAAFINPGHVIACELFRRRSDMEGIFRN
jgi:hypothetical protein